MLGVSPPFFPSVPIYHKSLDTEAWLIVQRLKSEGAVFVYENR